MSRNVRLSAAVVAMGMLFLTAATRAADVELLVRGPDGRPLAQKEIVVTPTESHTHAGETEAPHRTTTDDAGVAHFTWPAGVSRMKVEARGVGYGQTGLAEFVPEKAAHPPLPPLVRFAALDGTVPAEALKHSGTTVRLVRKYDGPEEGLSVRLAADGTFHIELPAGDWWVYATDGADRLAQHDGAVHLDPGQRLSGLQLAMLKPEAGRAQNLVAAPLPGKGQTVTWAAGTVRDSSGKPQAGARVYAVATFFGGIRMYESSAHAAADDRGRFELRGDGGLSSFSAVVVASAPGHPPAVTWIQPPEPPQAFVPQGSPQATSVPAPLPTPEVDLVLPDGGAALDVTVLQGGAPAPDVPVALRRRELTLRDVWAAGGREGPERQEVEDIVHPTLRTAADGTAHFDHLIPGLYDVIASPAGDPRRQWDRSVPRENELFGEAAGVPCRAGETAKFTLAMYPRGNTVHFRVTKHDGQPLTDKNVPFDFAAVINGGSGWSTSLPLATDGGAKMTFEHEGLWRATFKYRDSPTKWVPLQFEPYYAAEVVVAASPALAGAATVTATARRVEPASVEVELRDRDGKPVKGGAVGIGSIIGRETLCGSTDASGVVRFDGVPAWKDFVWGSLPAAPPIALEEGDAPLPGDEQLRHRYAILAEPVTTTPDAHLRVALREQPVGFVRGRVRGAEGKTSKRYDVYPAGPQRGANGYYRRDSGEFVVGPFAPGKVKIVLVITDAASGAGERRQVQEAEVRAGEVTHLDLTPAAEAAALPGGDATTLFGMNGISSQGGRASQLTGRVLLSPGGAPAWGAHVYYLEADSTAASVLGITDALGAIRARGVWRSGNGAADVGGAPSPLVVAILDGSRGAVTTVPAGDGKPLELVLPEPLSVRGRVTIGGKPPAGGAGSIRVAAQHVGEARIDRLLGVSTTPRADGTFELSGLSEGHYIVQAALDDVWLSPQVTLDLPADNGRAIDLAVGEPGGPIVVNVRDARGRPVCGRGITVDRPAGPLAEALWPARFVTDGAGVARVPALEVGRHAIHVDGSAVNGEVAAPPVTQPEPAVLNLQLPP